MSRIFSYETSRETLRLDSFSLPNSCLGQRLDAKDYQPPRPEDPDQFLVNPAQVDHQGVFASEF